MINLSNKVALVTGGSRGIGASTVRMLRSNGASVLFCARNEISIQSLESELNSGEGFPPVIGLVCDMESQQHREELIADVKARFQRLDILINNVGGGGRWGESDPLKPQNLVWDECIDKNLGSMRQLCSAFVPDMVTNGWGRVITVASIFGTAGGGRPWFQVAKAAQINFSKNLSLRPEFASRGVTFNCVSPGPVLIPGTGWHSEFERKSSLYQKTIDATPIRRLIDPAEVTSLITFLASDSSAGINGQNIVVDGGRLEGL